MEILLIEDDRDVAEYVQRCLQEENHRVTCSFDGEAGLRDALTTAADIIILDVMLPRQSGFEITRRIRAAGVETPVLLLTAPDATQDIVDGFEAGADDYLTKPFSFDVLLARLRARTRRIPGADRQRLRFADLLLDLNSREVRRGDSLLNLTRTKFAILECLMRAGPRVITRQTLYDTIWGSQREVCNNNIDVFIRFLRTKVDMPGLPRLIHTIRGVGFCLRDRAW